MAHTDCPTGQACAPWPATGEMTCSAPCATHQDCPAGFQCHKQGSSVSAGYCTTDAATPASSPPVELPPSESQPAPTRPVPAPAPPPVEPAAAPVDAEVPFEWYESALGWTFTGIGLAAAMTGIVLTLVAGTGDRGSSGPFISSPEVEADRDQQSTLEAASIVISAALLTAGIVTFIVVDEDVEPDEDAARLQYIAPTVLDGGAGLSMGFSF